MSMTWDFILRLFVAGALGTVIGLDREYRAKEAGYRTHFLVSTGKCSHYDCVTIWFYGSSEDGGNRPGPESCGRTGCQRYRFYWSGYYYFSETNRARAYYRCRNLGYFGHRSGYWSRYVLAGGISATILTLIGLEALSYLFKSIGMKSSMVEFSTDNKETLNRMAKKFNSKEYNIVSYQLDEKRLGEVTTYYVTMVIKSKKYNDEGMLLTLLQDFSDITVHRLE